MWTLQLDVNFFISFYFILQKTFCNILVRNSVTRKNLPNVFKSYPKMFHEKNDRFWHFYKNCLRMREIWANELLPKALKSCPKSNKFPNLVTLATTCKHLKPVARRNKTRQTCWQKLCPIFSFRIAFWMQSSFKSGGIDCSVLK